MGNAHMLNGREASYELVLGDELQSYHYINYLRSVTSHYERFPVSMQTRKVMPQMNDSSQPWVFIHFGFGLVV